MSLSIEPEYLITTPDREPSAQTCDRAASPATPSFPCSPPVSTPLLRSAASLSSKRTARSSLSHRTPVSTRATSCQSLHTGGVSVSAADDDATPSFSSASSDMSDDSPTLALPEISPTLTTPFLRSCAHVACNDGSDLLTPTLDTPPAMASPPRTTPYLRSAVALTGARRRAARTPSAATTMTPFAGMGASTLLDDRQDTEEQDEEPRFEFDAASAAVSALHGLSQQMLQQLALDGSSPVVPTISSPLLTTTLIEPMPPAASSTYIRSNGTAAISSATAVSTSYAPRQSLLPGATLDARTPPSYTTAVQAASISMYPALAASQCATPETPTFPSPPVSLPLLGCASSVRVAGTTTTAATAIPFSTPVCRSTTPTLSSPPKTISLLRTMPKHQQLPHGIDEKENRELAL